MKQQIVGVLAAVFIYAGIVHAEGDLFPFVLPWDDGKSGPTKLELPMDAPAGKNGFVRVEDGHLVVGKTGEVAQRLRLFGVNFSFSANFPTHEQAEKVAARLEKFGVNAVRFHHMDSNVAPSGIFLPDRKTLDPAQLERMDYLFYCLKSRGIYVDMNLKVSRLYPEFADIKGLPPKHKGLDLFNRTMIDEQKQYARDLLTHVNPYTKLSYAQDPAVAIVEINNENGLLDNWTRGRFDKLPEPFFTELRTLWGEWLKRDAGDLSAAQTRYSSKEEAPGKKLINLEPKMDVFQEWKVQTNRGGADSAEVTENKPPVIRLHVGADIGGNDEAADYCEFVGPEFSLEQGKNYTLMVKGRALPARTLTLEIRDAAGGRSDLRSFEGRLNDTLQELDFSFQWTEPSVQNARLCFAKLEKKSGDLEIASCTLQEGGNGGWPLKVENGLPVLLSRADYSKYMPQLQTAWTRFLWDTESAYWKEMADLLKNEIKVRAPLLGTQLGAYSIFPIQQQLDVIDIHTYWKHPQYPKPDKPDFWTVGTESMLEDVGGGTIPAIALRRVAGKPFVCTEYNNVMPNMYGAEGFIVSAAYAALQDMDGMFIYSYSHFSEKFDRQALPGLFDVDQHPLKMATMPIASVLFLRQDVQAAKNEKVAGILPEDALKISTAKGTRVDGFTFGLSLFDPLRERVAIKLTEDKSQAVRPSISDEHFDISKPIISDTGELRWTPVQGRKSIFTADTPRSKCLVGFSDGKSVAVGDFTFAPSKNWSGWSVLAVSSSDQKELGQSGTALLIACGRAENTDWQWRDDSKTSLRSWGSAPSLVNGINATIQWKLAAGKKLSVWALDEKGQRKLELPVTKDSEDRWSFQINPQYRTIWYQLSVQ